MQDTKLELSQAIVQDLCKKINLSKRENKNIKYIVLPEYSVELIKKYYFGSYLNSRPEKIGIDYFEFMGYKLIPEEETLTTK